MRHTLYLLAIFSIVLLSSCRQDFDFERSSGTELRFSRDTVYLDTVFTNIGSSTYTLKVYNNSDKDITIPSIQLSRGLASKYRMTVDGMQGNQGKIFNNVELLAKDSMFIFIETTAEIADANPEDFLYTDQIQFGSGTSVQNVELVTLIKDAHFLYPQRFENGTYENIFLGETPVYGFFLDENDPVNGNEYHFTNEKPYVIYGYAAVGSDKTLKIDPGARVHFHANSALLVASGGAIQALGDYSSTDQLENEIIFEGDRLEPGFSDFPGQWLAIWLTSGSASSSFEHVTIKNATIGLYIQNNSGSISLKNTQIYNSSNYGILAQTATIKGENVVVNSAGQVALACTLGGSYEFKHSTFNNNWASSRQLAVLIDNYYSVESDQDAGTIDQVAFDLQKAEFHNCIIYGTNQVELRINKSAINPNVNWTTPVFNKVLVKFNNSNNDYTNHPDYEFLYDTSNVKKNQNPRFEDVSRNKLRIGEDSAAIGFGDPLISQQVPVDLAGQLRNTSSDLGAYQSTTFGE
ncbi:MAG: hypothetical protein IR153_01095 [Flavobacterium sp.]|nr:hypothetical protein [Flavobacterium sp.]